MYKLTLGEIRFIMGEMMKEVTSMERGDIIRSHTANQLLWFRNELDKRLVEFCDKKGVAK